MQIYSKILIILSLAFLASCSQSYTNLQNSSLKPSDQLSKYLLIAYKEKADFEAQKMHDWNSAKLYSEKALNAAQGIKILPQKISYWKISSNKNYEISKGFDNLMIVYEDASTIDPFNLAKAISSLDCWAEQLEEKCTDALKNTYIIKRINTILKILNKEDMRIPVESEQARKLRLAQAVPAVMEGRIDDIEEGKLLLYDIADLLNSL